MKEYCEQGCCTLSIFILNMDELSVGAKHIIVYLKKSFALEVLERKKRLKVWTRSLGHFMDQEKTSGI